MKLLGKSSQCGEKCPQGSQVFSLLLRLLLFSLSFFLFPLFFISYVRQSLLPNREAPQDLIIQKTRAPQRMRGTSKKGEVEESREKDEVLCNGGNGVFACVCVLSSLLMNVKYQSHGAFCTSQSLPPLTPSFLFSLTLPFVACARHTCKIIY